MKTKLYMAIDQYGTTYHGLRNPRKDLLEKLAAANCKKVYKENERGDIVHVGYYISGLWLTLYEVIPFEKN